MRIVITGSHGLIGSALTRYLSGAGHHVLRLVRGRPADDREIQWDPARDILEPDERLDSVDGVVHFVDYAGY